MLLFLKMYLVALLVFFVVDMLWLGIIAKRFYNDQIGHLLKTNVNWGAAILFYLIFIAGIVTFVLMPAWNDGSFVKALLLGGLFGFIAYSTYDLTNLATMKDWPLLITVVDLLWGTALGALTASISYGILTLLP
ncbi:MAG: DUF2177 family protein [Candidatus Izemoplasmataceae bacterium]